MSNTISIYTQYIASQETIVELPNGYTADDIAEVRTKWGQSSIEMKDGKSFGPTRYSSNEAPLDVVETTRYYEDGDDLKMPEYHRVSTVALDEEDEEYYEVKEVVLVDGVNLYAAQRKVLDSLK